MKHVALIFGGPSAEHEVSLVSAKNIYQVLKETSLEVSLIGITKNRVWKLIKGDDLLKTNFVTPLDLNKVGSEIKLFQNNNHIYIEDLHHRHKNPQPVEVAFPIIHGPFGEDGQLQIELNEIGLPFVGCDSLSCENSFDKGKTKTIMASKGIPQARFLTFTTSPSFTEVKNQLGLPFFVKPANMGSSIGISKVKGEDSFQKAINDAFLHDSKIVIEESITGREIECALLEGPELKASGLGEVVPKHEFYSYEAKYLDPNGADLIIPAKLDQKISDQIRSLAIDCFKALGCRDYARADFFLTADHKIYFNEINTHPGFTNISQFPMLWKQEGVDYKTLILTLLNQAYSRS